MLFNCQPCSTTFKEVQTWFKQSYGFLPLKPNLALRAQQFIFASNKGFGPSL
jgi:hypothetical protein